MKLFRLLNRLFFRITNFINYIILLYYKVDYKHGLRINGILQILGEKKKIIIGDDVIINSGNKIIPIGFPGKTTFWSLGGKISIGNGCGISNSTFCSMENITIGNHVLLGGGVKIYDTDFHSQNYIIRRDLHNDNNRKSKKIVIGNDVFIGAGAIILKGSNIGNKSIIGAGSAVTGTIPPNEVWGGNPARFIKRIDRDDYENIMDK